MKGKCCIKKVVFVPSLLAAGRLLAATMTWTGGGNDNLWSTGANWGGTAPGAGDTAVFDGTSAKACTVDVAEVLNVAIAAGYTGTITLGNAFTVLNKFEQLGGTFSCGDCDFTVGASISGKNGIFTLKGGTFNAPSGNLTWLPQRQWNGGVVTIDGGGFNANGGTFVAAMVATSGGQHNGSDFFVYNTTFQNLTVRSLYQSPRLTCLMTNNVICGDLRIEGGQLVDGVSRERGNTNNWVRNVRLDGDLYVGKFANGGSLAVSFESAADQTIHFVRDGASALPRCCGLVVDKPNGAKVKVVSDDGGAWFGYGSDDRNPSSASYGYNCFSGIWVERGVLDFSAVDEMYALFDTGSAIRCAKSENADIIWPQKTVLNYRLVLPASIKGMAFKDLYLVAGNNTISSGDYATNSVSGTLTLRSASVGGSGLQMDSSPSTWRTYGPRSPTIAASGDVIVDNPYGWENMGGTGSVLLCGDGEQVIHVTNNAALCSMVVNKPAGKVRVDSQDGSPLAFASNGSSANGGHFILENGEIEFPAEGVSFTNTHFTTFLQFGGNFTWKDGCVMRFGHRNGLNYSFYMGAQQALPSILQTKGCTMNPMTDRPIRLSGDVTVEANLIAGTTVFEGSRDQTYRSSTGADVFRNASGSVGGLKIAKTGGRVICETPLMGRYLELCDGTTIAFSITNATAEVSARGEAGWNEPPVKASARLTLPKNGVVNLKGTTPIRRSSPMKWNVFGYSAIDNLATASFKTQLPNVNTAKLLQETTEKLLYLQYLKAEAMAIILR